MFRLQRKNREYYSKTPQWFKDWDFRYFRPVDSRSSRNEKLIYLILAAVLGLNTAGNYFHKEIADFILKLSGS